MSATKIDIQVYGMHERDNMIQNLKEKLSLSDDHIFYDDRPNGGLCIYTAKKAWLASVPKEVTHRVALADDTDVCNGFHDIATQIAQAHPKAIISFLPYEFMSRNPEIEDLDTPYFKAHVLWGAAIMMPIEYLKPCFDWIKEQFDDEIADDDGIERWARSQGIEILTTVPAIVQHIGDDSLLDPGRVVRRTVYYSENPEANWTSTKVMQYREKEWFFSNHGKRRINKGVLEIVSK